MDFSFKIWLEVDAATYNTKLKYRTDRAAKERIDPFKNFFPAGQQRIYFKPMNITMPAQIHAKLDPMQISQEDRAVVTALNNAGYQVLDYNQGYAQKGKRIERIGKILDRLLSMNKDFNTQTALRAAKQRFISAPHRAFSSASNMWIIISQNPHDIAQMSYTRSWKSCMDIENGMYCRSPYAVIRSGGLIAYLVNAPEEVVKNLINNNEEYIPSKIAIARVSIKTAINPSGEPVAVLEKRVYPMNIKGFWESVNAWLEKQQNSSEGRYKVFGGYSDSYSNKSFTNVPKDHNGLFNYLKSGITSRKDAALDYILNSTDEFPPVIWNKVKEILLEEGSKRYTTNNYKDKLAYLYKRFPNLFSEKELNNLQYSSKGDLGLLSKPEKGIFDTFASPLKDSKHYAIPLEKNRLTELLKDLDSAAQEGISDADLFAPMYTWLSNGHDLERFSRPQDNSQIENIRIVKEQQRELSNKLLNILANIPFNKMKMNYSSKDYISSIVMQAIDRYLDRNNLEDVKKILIKFKNDPLMSQNARYRFNMKAREVENKDPELASEIDKAYKGIYGNKYIEYENF